MSTIPGRWALRPEVALYQWLEAAQSWGQTATYFVRRGLDVNAEIAARHAATYALRLIDEAQRTPTREG